MTPRRNSSIPLAILGAIFVGAFAFVAWRLTSSPERPRETPVSGPVARAARSAVAASPDASGDPRIVALSPAIAVILRDLGLDGDVVGRHGYDMVLPKDIPVCGDQAGIDYEALIGVRPTHVLLEWGSRELPGRLVDLASERGWVLKSYELLTLDQVARCARDLNDMSLAHRAADPAAPNASAAVLDRMNTAWFGPPPAARKTGRILLVESIDPPGILGPGSFHHQILERLGATPAIAEGKPFMTLDAEDVARLAPEGIIIFSPRSYGAPPGDPPTADQLRQRLGRIGTLDLPAFKAGRVALIDDPLCLLPGTSLLAVHDEMDAILKRWSTVSEP